jgi:hypothetical protein
VVQFDGDVRGPFGERKLGPALQANDDVTVEVTVFSVQLADLALARLVDWLRCTVSHSSLTVQIIAPPAADGRPVACRVSFYVNGVKVIHASSPLDVALSHLLVGASVVSLCFCRRVARSTGPRPACPCGPSFRSVRCLEATLRVSDLLTLLLCAVVCAVVDA